MMYLSSINKSYRGVCDFKAAIECLGTCLVRHAGILLIAILLQIQAHGETPAGEDKWLEFGAAREWRVQNLESLKGDIGVAWELEIGNGRSQVVGSKAGLYVATGSEASTDKLRRAKTQIHCLDHQTGEVRWTREWAADFGENQQTFGGEKASPQATPLLTRSVLVVLDFTGQLHGFDRVSGERKWNIDLVAEHGATPVQFGFSSSPVSDPDNPSRVCVHAGGPAGGILCLDPRTGETIWKSPCKSPSYATPLAADFGGVPQWVIVTENAIRAVARDDGRPLWRYDLPEAGLTNVPTPLRADATGLVVSGQGCQGTRCLDIAGDESGWKVSERWYVRSTQFFYTNWINVRNHIVLGCAGSFLVALDIKSGELRGKWRGFGEGNVTASASEVGVLTGEGVLQQIAIRESDQGMVLDHVSERAVLEARCWTPSSVVDGCYFIRGGNRLICLAPQESATIANRITKPTTLAWRKSSQSEPANDSKAVQAIFERFEQQGQEAAFELYSEKRKQGELGVQERLQLIEAAHDQGLREVSLLMLTHAKEDFPQSELIEEMAKSLK